MKKYSIVLLLYNSASSSSICQSISSTYSPQDNLKNVEQIDIYAYLSSGGTASPKMQKVALQKAGNVWKGQFATQADTKAFALGVFEASKGEIENNKGKGYTQVMYDTKKKPLSAAYAAKK